MGIVSEASRDLNIRGTFAQPNGTPISDASIYEVFLGQSPTNCGAAFDLDHGKARTDTAGTFCLDLRQPDERLGTRAPSATWQRGYFLVLAAKDARTIGYVVATGEELVKSLVHLVSIPTDNLIGHIQSADGMSVANAQVALSLYYMFVGRGPCPNTPINFWLARSGRSPTERRRVTDLVTITDEDGNFDLCNVPMMPGGLLLTISHRSFAGLGGDLV